MPSPAAIQSFFLRHRTQLLSPPLPAIAEHGRASFPTPALADDCSAGTREKRAGARRFFLWHFIPCITSASLSVECLPIPIWSSGAKICPESGSLSRLWTQILDVSIVFMPFSVLEPEVQYPDVFPLVLMLWKGIRDDRRSRISLSSPPQSHGRFDSRFGRHLRGGTRFALRA
jgi:hypothetical protein